MHPSSSSSTIRPTASPFTPLAPCPSLMDMIPVVDCTVCSKTHPQGVTRSGNLTCYNNQQGLPGRMAFLRSLKPIDSGIHPASCVYQQIHSHGNKEPLNIDAGGHPCLILTQSLCGHQVFCAQMTSFGGRSLEDKFNRVRNATDRQRMLDEYVPLRQARTSPRKPHNQLRELEYEGTVMKEQSFAHLEFGFWIEWRNLGQWGDRRLTADSLSFVTRLYAVAEFNRQSFGSSGIERLNRAICGAHQIPTPSPSPPLARAMPKTLFRVPLARNAAIAIKAPSPLPPPPPPLSPPVSPTKDMPPSSQAKYVPPAKRKAVHGNAQGKKAAMNRDWRSEA